MKREKEWFLYILECMDSSLYTGITTDVECRFEKHKEGLGAKYTKMKGVKRLVYSEKIGSKSEALKRELEIKSWSREKKCKLTSY